LFDETGGNLGKTATITVHIQQAKAGEGIERSPHDIKMVDEHG
jgi:hypothetical protein